MLVQYHISPFGDILATVHGFSWIFLLGRFDFEKISKSILRSFSTGKTKMQISIAVRHQDSCKVAVQILFSSERYIYYFLVHDRIR